MYTASGIYFSSYNTADGCPSTDTLFLTVNYNTNAGETVTACDSYSWSNHGNLNTYTVSGTYTSSYNTADGCPSVDTLYLTVNYNSSASETQYACDSYLWNNHGNSNSYTATGVYYSSYYTADGCLSVDTLNLTVFYNTNTTYDSTACDVFTWNNHGNTNVYTASGIYTSNYSTAEGCPSTDTLILTVNYRNTGVATVYAHNSYTWIDGNTYSATDSTATYTLSNANAAGCDSVVTLHLYIQHQITTMSDLSQGVTTGDTLAVHGDVVTIMALNNYGYHFTQWSDGVTANPRTVTVLRDSTFTAEFAANNYVVADTLVDATRGTVLGTGIYAYLSTATLTARANYGYRFVMWENGSTDSVRTLTVERDTHVTATFMPADFYITVNTASANGTVTGSGSYAYLTTATISATASTGYEFTGWTDGVTSNPRVVTVTSDSTFTATFAPLQYMIAGTSADTVMGTVSGSGMYPYDSTATLTATANYGYAFLMWADGDTTNPRTVTVRGNANYTAVFTVRQFHLTVLAAANGNASGSGDFDYQSSQVISATADNGYHFTQWSDGVTANPRIVTILSDTAFTAQFAINSYTVRVTSVDTNFGTATGSGLVFTLGSVDTLTATPAAGYDFVQWSDGNTDNPRYLTVTSDMQLIAIFSVNSYRVITYVNDPTMGTVTGAGSYPYNTVATITAVPEPHYHFLMWSDSVTENPRNVLVLQDEVYTAIFASDTHHIDVISSNNALGTVSGSGDYCYGTSAVISATPAAGYSFAGWNDGDMQNPRSVIVTGDVTYTADFAVTAFTVTTYSNDSTMGVVAGGGNYNYGEEATLMAQPMLFHHFVEWSDGNADNPRIVGVYSDTAFTAVFEADRFYIDVIASDPSAGVTSGTGTYDYGDSVRIKATANPGFQFMHWSDGETTNPRDIVVAGDETYVAIFEPAMYTVLVSSNDDRMGTANGSGVYAYGDHAQLDAAPNMGYVFLRWSDGSTENPRTVTVTSDTMFRAIFSGEAITISVRCNPREGHAFLAKTDSSWVENDALTYSYADTVLLYARPRPGYHFVRWSDGSTDTARLEYALEDMEYYAFFEPDFEGIEDAETVDNVIIYSNGDRIIVREAEGKSIAIFDAVGKCLVNEQRNTMPQREFRMPATGVYLVKVGNAAAKRVIIMK